MERTKEFWEEVEKFMDEIREDFRFPSERWMALVRLIDVRRYQLENTNEWEER